MMKFKKHITMSLLALILGVMSSCVKDYETLPQNNGEQRPLLTLLENNYSFSIFYEAAKRLGLEKTLSGSEGYTLLVPDNDAFAAAGITAETATSLDTATLRKIISYHMIKGALPFNKIQQTIDYKIISTAIQPVYFSVPILSPNQRQTTQALHINGVNVKKIDVLASNGVIHVLEKVLAPPTESIKTILQNNPDYSLFVQALKQFNLFDQLDKPGPFVILVPGNEVFEQNGINESTMAALDTLTYKKLLFASYILPDKFFFSTDVLDGPLIGSSGLHGADYNLQIDIYGNFQLLPDVVSPFYYPNTVQFADPNHLALNGVVHKIDNLLITPEFATKP